MINSCPRRLNTVLVLAIIMCFTSLFTVTAQTICSEQSSSQGGYTYEFWKDSGGTACMTLNDGGKFYVEWSGINNVLARKGLRPGSSNVTVSYGVNYQPNGNSYLCVYGWTTDPLVEYYIVDSWGDWRPPGATSKGTVNIDGGTYDIYETTRTEQPSIVGIATFQQYWSVRTSRKTSGTISCGQHFSAWASKGMNMGSFYEVSFCIEGYKSSGTADVYSMSMSTGSTTTSISPTPVPSTTTSSGGGGTSYTVRARGTAGSEKIRLKIGSTIVQTWTMTTSFANYTASSSLTGAISVEFFNDSSGLDVEVDYIDVGSERRQSENQSSNTAVYQNGQCGGSYSAMMHCNGAIQYGNTPGSGSTTTSAGSTTTTTTSTGSTTTTTTSTATTTTTTSTATTTTSTSGGGGCSPDTAKTCNFSYDGAGEYCWSFTSIGGYMNCWNATEVKINGVDYTNTYVGAGNLPAKIDGKYYVYYKATVSWAHIEVKN